MPQEKENTAHLLDREVDDYTVQCPSCKKPYSFQRPRVTTWPNGERRDECLGCGVIREKLSPYGGAIMKLS